MTADEVLEERFRTRPRPDGRGLDGHADFYTVRNPRAYDVDWAGFYTEAAEAAVSVRARYAHAVAVPYGAHPRQRLDLLFPAGRGPDLPSTVVAFVHGGGFREGAPGYYDTLAPAYLDRGYGFASIGYRLAPESTVLDAAADVADALGFLRECAMARGGARRFVLVGHSAGALIAAMLATGSSRALPADVLAGVACVSGGYDLAYPEGLRVGAGDPQTVRPDRNIQRLPPPMLVAFGWAEANANGADPTYAARSSMELVQAVGAAGGSCGVLGLARASHLDTARLVGDERSELFAAITRLAPEPGVPLDRRDELPGA